MLAPIASDTRPATAAAQTTTLVAVTTGGCGIGYGTRRSRIERSGSVPRLRIAGVARSVLSERVGNSRSRRSLRVANRWLTRSRRDPLWDVAPSGASPAALAGLPSRLAPLRPGRRCGGGWDLQLWLGASRSRTRRERAARRERRRRRGHSHVLRDIGRCGVRRAACGVERVEVAEGAESGVSGRPDDHGRDVAVLVGEDVAVVAGERAAPGEGLVNGPGAAPTSLR